MAAFTVNRAAKAPDLFVVMGPDGLPVVAINDFLQALAHRGRSAYTLRSYAHGLAHFFEWLHSVGQAVDDVTPQTVEAYIAALSTSPKGGACPGDAHTVGQVNPITRKVAPAVHRQPRTINHRLSVLAAFFAYRMQQDSEQGSGRWVNRTNPVPSSPSGMNNPHGMPGRDAPKRGKAGDLRRRVPRQIHRLVEPALAEQFIATARSWRDKAILTLLYRTGQRIGDWSAFAGRHGILGMTLADVDERTHCITVRLKGARDEHRVPVTDDFWPLLQQYLRYERRADPSVTALWLEVRKGHGKPLSYAAFESALRYIGRKLGANVNAHMFRHTLAQAMVDQGQLKVAQEVLGHRHVTTTADSYAHVDQDAMAEALQAVKHRFDTQRAEREAPPGESGRPETTRYVFAYDEATLEELDQAATQSPMAPE